MWRVVLSDVSLDGPASLKYVSSDCNSWLVGEQHLC